MRAMAYVGIGGAIGAGTRWTMGEFLASSAGEFPWATLLVNIAGCLGIGVAARQLSRSSDAWLVVAVGLLGGLTTFSAFAVETQQLVDAGRELVAVTYVLVSVLAGSSAAAIARGNEPS